ncbi:MAG: RNA-binding cell elongation regulator Jag/EloR [Anaerolineae bacterium]
MDQRNERRNVVASGKTVDEAIRNGLQMLGVRRNEVDVEIITEGSRGVLGFGAENARVRLLVKAPPKPEPVKRAPAEPPKQEAPSPSPSPTPAPAAEPEVEGEEPTAEAVGLEVLSEVLRLMGIRATVETQLGSELADEDEEPPVVLNITGEDLGILIGRRGETLRALQYLVRLMVSHRLKHWTNLVVDVENYLIRRRRSLESLANRMAEQAVRTGRIQALEPMPAYERRLVHIALRKNPKVTTQSIGEGERRKVTVVPKK